MKQSDPEISQNTPLSEQYRVKAKKWVQADSAASLLEECKSAFLSQRMTALGEMPVSRAEMMVKASLDWEEYVTKMVKAREAANLLKVNLEYIRMRSMEWQSHEASKRVEARL